MSFFRDADGVIVCFDLTRHDTFIAVSDWVSGLLQQKGKGLPIVLAGNKKDLCEDLEQNSERQVASEEGQELATKYNSAYMETSAKTDEGVQDLMENIFEQILVEKLK